MKNEKSIRDELEEVEEGIKAFSGDTLDADSGAVLAALNVVRMTLKFVLDEAPSPFTMIVDREANLLREMITKSKPDTKEETLH